MLSVLSMQLILDVTFISDCAIQSIVCITFANPPEDLEDLCIRRRGSVSALKVLFRQT